MAPSPIISWQIDGEIVTDFIFMAAVTTHSDFGAQEHKVCHYFPIYLPQSDGTRCHDFSFLNVEF